MEIWVIQDEHGGYQLGKDRDEAIDRYKEDIDSNGARRVIKVELTIPPPADVVVAGSISLPEEKGSISAEIVP